jgi:hypothetical protein
MKRAAMVVVLLVVIAGVGLYASGCTHQEARSPVAGPVGPTGPMRPDAPPVAGTFTYVCPDHADQTSSTPAKCPICGKPMKADTSEPVEYFCPTHPDVVQPEPGECPKCGAVLEARAVTAPVPGGEAKDASPTPPSAEPGKTPAEPEKGDAGTT